MPGPAVAHTVPPDAIVARLASEASRREAGIVSVARDDALPRLLVIRVGPAWSALSVARRQALARQWWTAWRHAVAQGIVAVLDAATDRSLVTFAREGTPRITRPDG